MPERDAEVRSVLKAILELLKQLIVLLQDSPPPPPPPPDDDEDDDEPDDPPPPPPDDPDCPRPTGIKLGWRGESKRKQGWRSVWDATPLVEGKPVVGPCWVEKYGPPEAFQTLHVPGGFTNAPVERSSENPHLLVIASNDERLWTTGRYAEAGPMTIGVSYAWLPFWRCQNVTMGDDGRIRGAGTNAQSFDKPK